MRALLAATLLLPAIAAQDPIPRVDPTPFEFVQTARETGWPFGYPDRRTLRYLQVHDGLAGTPRQLTAIAFRRSPTDPREVPAFLADVSLRLSTARTTAATIAGRFDDNIGDDAVEVLPRRWVSFPATSGPFDGPAPFDFSLPADVPFAFGGEGSLCLELRVHEHTSRTPFRFALYAEGYSHQATFGTGCGGLSIQTLLTPAEAAHQVSGAPAGAPIVLLFGAELDVAFDEPLPFDLTPLGAPGCALWLDPFIEFRGFADAAGALEFRVPIAAAPPSAFYAVQALTVQPGLNALGAVFSDANLILPQSGRILGRVWAEEPTAETGVRQPVFGLVLEAR